MKEPAQFAQQVEDHPQLPAAACERVSGYGVMGLPFQSGHVLGLRRWTASSVGERFTSIWHRDPDGRWTFYESVRSQIACTRYFGADVEHAHVGPIRVDWDGPRRLHVCTAAGSQVDWTIEVGATLITRVMSMVGAGIPASAWRSRPVLVGMGHVAGWVLGVGKVQLTGMTSNGQHFDANPRRIWYVTGSKAVVEGQDLGPVGPLPEQAHMADFYFPQRGIFAVGRVYVTPGTDREAARRTAHA
jgi:hypothetical protein